MHLIPTSANRIIIYQPIDDFDPSYTILCYNEVEFLEVNHLSAGHYLPHMKNVLAAYQEMLDAHWRWVAVRWNVCGKRGDVYERVTHGTL